MNVTTIEEVKHEDETLWWRILLVVFFQICSGYFNGLNIGLMSMDVKYLEIQATGPFESKAEEEEAKKLEADIQRKNELEAELKQVDERIKVIKQLENLKVSARDRMQHHDAWMDPNTHQMQQTIYLATANVGTKDPDDMFKILGNSAPKDVMDVDSAPACKLETYEATSTFDA